MSNIISLNKKQKPVTYTIYVTSGYDGKLEAQFADIGDDDRSIDALIRDLHYIIELLEQKQGSDGRRA